MRVWSRQEQRDNRARFWRLVTGGTSISVACEMLGVSWHTGRRWIRESGGRAPVAKPASSGRYLSIDERIQIADLTMAGCSMRSIAAQIGRSPSTVSRELCRNGPGAGRRYGPHAAQKRAAQRARRPRGLKLDNEELAAVVQAKLCKKWSPEQISLHLHREYPDRVEMRVAHETIYQALFRKAPSLAGLHVHLRTRRRMRRPRGLTSATSTAHCRHDHDRRAPGECAEPTDPRALGGRSHSWARTAGPRSRRSSNAKAATCCWWGCLMVIVHQRCATRSSRRFNSCPNTCVRRLTWDQGAELARHKEIALATELKIYFCDPHSPWQRGSNENTNGLVRQYFPKGTDLSVHNQHRLAEVADELNNRPRKTLNMNTPAELMANLLSPHNATTVRNERVATTT